MSSGSMAGMMNLTMEMKDMMNTTISTLLVLAPEFAAGYMMNIQKACWGLYGWDIPESLDLWIIKPVVFEDEDKISLLN